MKIRTHDEGVIKHGKVNLPDIGIVEVPSDGVIEVPDELGQHLIDNAPAAWKKHHFQSNKKNEKPAAAAASQADLSGKPDAEDNDEGENEQDDEKASEVAQYRIELLKKSIDALRDVASALELPQDEYEKLTKLQLVNYILDKTKDED